MKIKTVITGATGMVGEGVLQECLQHPDVEKVLALGRRPCGVAHPKLIEIVHADFYDLSPVAPLLTGYNACFFCLGVSSVGMKEPEYSRTTRDLTLHVAGILAKKNPDMTFCYVSGAGTDSSEKGKLMWARIKGRTENELMKMPFRRIYAFRPAFIQPTRGLKNTQPYYKYLGWLFAPGRALFPGYFCTLAEVGLAMIRSVTRGYEKLILEVRDIVALAKDR